MFQSNEVNRINCFFFVFLVIERVSKGRYFFFFYESIKYCSTMKKDSYQFNYFFLGKLFFENKNDHQNIFQQNTISALLNCLYRNIYLEPNSSLTCKKKKQILPVGDLKPPK